MAETVPWDDLDQGIIAAVHALADYGVETFSSCQAGPGHGAMMPEVLFRGGEHAGLWAVWLLETQGFKVQSLARYWDLDHGLPREPFWQVWLRTTEPTGPGPGTIRVNGHGDG